MRKKVHYIYSNESVRSACGKPIRIWGKELIFTKLEDLVTCENCQRRLDANRRSRGIE